MQNCENGREPYFFFSEDVLKYCYAIMDSLQPEASITTTFFKEECIQINDLSGIKMRDEDIVVILSNLLNNAIEACESAQAKKL